MQWAALFFAPLCTFLLFAIEEIGVQLEEPFRRDLIPKRNGFLFGSLPQLPHRGE